MSAVTWKLVNIVDYCSTFTPFYHIRNAQSMPRYYAVEEGKNTDGKGAKKWPLWSIQILPFFRFSDSLKKPEPLSASDFLLAIITLKRFICVFSRLIQLIRSSYNFLNQKPAQNARRGEIFTLIVLFLAERGVLISQSGWPCLTG